MARVFNASLTEEIRRTPPPPPPPRPADSRHDFSATVGMEQWFYDLVEALKDLVARCKSAGVPADLLTDHVSRLVEDAAKRGIRVKV